jgi:hypothetical protein
MLLAALALSSVSVLGTADADAARARRAAPVGSFDGTWSVSVATTAGPCDSSFRFPIQIAGGRVFSRDIGGVSGRVNARGAVQVSIQQADRAAVGAGRLSGNSGAGRWNGRSASGRCTGVWQATR